MMHFGQIENSHQIFQWEAGVRDWCRVWVWGFRKWYLMAAHSSGFLCNCFFHCLPCGFGVYFPNPGLPALCALLFLFCAACSLLTFSAAGSHPLSCFKFKEKGWERRWGSEIRTWRCKNFDESWIYSQEFFFFLMPLRPL